MLAAMDAAEESIYLETFIWKDDAVGQAFKELLIRKAQADVAVRVIFDGFGNMIVPHAFKVFPPSVHAIEYQAIRRPWQVLDPRRYALDHRKLLIVDGRVGFIGGYNLGDLYATEWRDTHLRVDVPAAARDAPRIAVAAAHAAIAETPGNVVVKADGLAAGQGRGRLLEHARG